MKDKDLPVKPGGAEAETGRSGTTIPGVCVRVAGKGLTRQGVRKSGKQRTCRRAFLRFGARQIAGRAVRRSCTRGGVECSRGGGIARGPSQRRSEYALRGSV